MSQDKFNWYIFLAFIIACVPFILIIAFPPLIASYGLITIGVVAGIVGLYFLILIPSESKKCKKKK